MVGFSEDGSAHSSCIKCGEFFVPLAEELFVSFSRRIVLYGVS